MLATAGITTGLGLDVDTAIDVADNALTHNWLQVALAAAELGIDVIEEHREDVIDYLKGATDYAESDISEAVDYLITGGKILSKATDLIPGKAAVKAPSKAVLKGVKTALKAEKSPVKGVVKPPLNDVKSKGAAHFLDKKLRLLQKVQKRGDRPVQLPDGRIRYYEKERLAHKKGYTRGNAYVVEHNPKTGQIRSWMESYDHDGKVTRVHPKTHNGRDLKKPHYPLTGKEKGEF